MIPTVRVANPANRATYMTINASDYREVVHGPLWAQQAPDYAGPPAAPTAVYGQDERNLAAALYLDALAFDYERRGAEIPFASLSSPQRLTILRDQRSDFETYRREWHRNNQRSDGDLFSAQPTATPTPPPAPQGDGELVQHQGNDPVYVAPTLEDAPPNPDAMGDVVEPVAEAGPTLDDLLGGQPPAPTAPEPAPAGTPTPSWAGKPAAPAVEGTSVQKGPGGKYYVMRGGNALSSGFRTKAEAEGDLPNHAAE